jgi:hypothetical protein
VRALRIQPAERSAQDGPPDTLQRWAERRRELLLEDRLDRLVTVLERLAGALERRAS